MRPSSEDTGSETPADNGDNLGETASQREIAVALQHERDGDGLPRVIASGRGSVAQQILEIAFARGIKVREDSDLAEILAAVDVDCEIPLPALAAVAEILSYIYQESAGQQTAPPDNQAS
ncbi:MAG: EscU/YscU/HrcU family type III secretion system export apparatus switch protein [Alphaproteobacteria bacterium]|nr:EscU/YscU/HrcU family type III secretion system export apparatus switch protein [Alphaproteobacteria bacterium]